MKPLWSRHPSWVQRSPLPRAISSPYYVRRSRLRLMPSPRTSQRRRLPSPNDPSLLIMTSLASGPKHGYGLFQDIEAFAGQRLGPGTLYGAIARLEGRGLIESLEPEGRTRPYRLTAAGEQALQKTLSEMRRLLDEGTARLARAPRASTEARLA
jgi:DNA-binding PadR family transcriptional regulator